jgi:hypothetical protein
LHCRRITLSFVGELARSPSPDVVSFCERCGGRLGANGRSQYAITCASCRCFVCSSCQATPSQCRWCLADATEASSAGRPTTSRRVAARGAAPGTRVVAVDATRTPSARAPTLSPAATETPTGGVLRPWWMPPPGASPRQLAGLVGAIAGLALLGLLAVAAVLTTRTYAPAAGVAAATGTPAPTATHAARLVTRAPSAASSPVSSAAPSSAKPSPSPSASPRSMTGPPASPAGAVANPPVAATARVTAAVARAWPNAVGATSIEVVVAVRNVGAGTIALEAAASTFRVRSGGSVVAAGRFDAAVPGSVSPHETGYLVATLSTPLVAPTAARRLSADARVAATPAVPDPGGLRVALRPPSYGPDTIRVPGTLSNGSTAAASNVMLGAVVLDDRGAPLAALYGLANAGPIAPNAGALFTLDYPPTGPLPRASVYEIDGFAWELTR